MPTSHYGCKKKLSFRGGGHLYFRLDIILVKGLSKHTLNTYFSGMKIDPKYAFLHAVFLICPSCPFQNMSLWPKTYPFFFNFPRFCTPKRCTRVHCLVLKNDPNYVTFYEDDIQLQIKVPPLRAVTFSYKVVHNCYYRDRSHRPTHVESCLIQMTLCEIFLKIFRKVSFVSGP